MADDRLRYALSEAESDRIFRTDIRDGYLPNDLGEAAAPTAVLLGGQPGAGKSKILDEATAELKARGPTVTINGDDLRIFHPRYTELQRTDPLNAARYTDADSGRWVEKLIRAAAKRRVNVVIEGTMRRPEVVEQTASALRNAGYRVEARAMAVAPEVSWQGVHQRFEAALAAGDAPRFSARETHDAAVSGMIDTLRQAEARTLVDRIEVSNRAGTKLYASEVTAAAAPAPDRMAADAVRAEHQRGFSTQELGDFEARWDTILTRMKERATPAGDLDRVSRDAAADIAAVRARSLPERRPGSVETTPAQGREENRGVVLELRPGGREHAVVQPRRIEPRRPASLGLTVAGSREASQDGDLMRAAQGYARAWAEVERQRGEGREPSAEQRRALEEAATALRRLRPQGPDDLVADLEREARERRAAEAAPDREALGQRQQDQTRETTADPGRDRDSDRLDRLVDLVAERVLETLESRAAERSAGVAARASRSQSMERERSVGREPTQERQVAQRAEPKLVEQPPETKPEWLIPPRAAVQLTEAEIAERARTSSVMERQREVIAQKSRIVTGDVKAGQDLVAAVEKNPSAAYEIARTFASDPNTEKWLAGRPGAVFRGESSERTAARAELPQLQHAVHDYGRSLVSERARVIREHEAEERRAQVGVRMPSADLRKALEASTERQTKLLAASAVRQELASLNLALHERLSTADRQSIAANDVSSASKSLGVPPGRVEAVVRTIRAVQQAAQTVQAMGRQQSRGPGINLSQ